MKVKERRESVTSLRRLRSDDKMHCGSLGSILEQKKGKCGKIPFRPESSY